MSSANSERKRYCKCVSLSVYKKEKLCHTPNGGAARAQEGGRRRSRRRYLSYHIESTRVWLVMELEFVSMEGRIQSYKDLP